MLQVVRKKILMAVRMCCSAGIRMPSAMESTQRKVSSSECTYSFSQINLAIRKAEENIKKLTPRSCILLQKPTVFPLVRNFV